MYTDDLRKKLNVGAPVGAKKLQLHRGFWTAYKAVDKQLMQEVNKQLKLLKVSGRVEQQGVHRGAGMLVGFVTDGQD